MKNALGFEIETTELYHNGEVEYLKMINYLLNSGRSKDNRTGTPAYTIAGYMLQHNLELGFPLFTTKKMPFYIISAELEGFIKGATYKEFYTERNCNIWNDWCNPKKVAYGTDKETKEKMKAESDLGYIYGFQWRNFNAEGYDQLKKIIDTLKEDKYNRRLVCSAWNPLQLNEMALPPCHLAWHLTVIEEELHLSWFQRSCDSMLGIPFNLASYSLLNELIAKECGLVPSTVTGFLSDVHIYNNHVSGAIEQIKRPPKKCPKLKFERFSNIFEWNYKDCKIEDYFPDEQIIFEIAV